MLTEEELRNRSVLQLTNIAKATAGDIKGDGHTDRLDLLQKVLRSKGAELPESVLAKHASPIKTITIKKASLPSNVEDDLLIARRYQQCFDSATKRGLEFNLSLSDMRSIMKRKRCAYTGIEFIPGDKKYFMTLERIDNTIGYVKGNVIPVCNFANQLKNTLIEDVTGEFYMTDKVLRKFIYTALAAHL